MTIQDFQSKHSTGHNHGAAIIKKDMLACAKASLHGSTYLAFRHSFNNIFKHLTSGANMGVKISILTWGQFSQNIMLPSEMEISVPIYSYTASYINVLQQLSHGGVGLNGDSTLMSKTIDSMMVLLLIAGNHQPIHPILAEITKRVPA